MLYSYTPVFMSGWVGQSRFFYVLVAKTCVMNTDGNKEVARLCVILFCGSLTTKCWEQLLYIVLRKSIVNSGENDGEIDPRRVRHMFTLHRRRADRQTSFFLTSFWTQNFTPTAPAVPLLSSQFKAKLKTSFLFESIKNFSVLLWSKLIV